MFWEWKYKRKDLYLHLCIFIKLFYKIHKCIKWIKIYSLIILIIWIFIMIDYSISDPTKQIWLNLQLYFESYDFSNFIEFSGIFLILFKFIFDFFSI